MDCYDEILEVSHKKQEIREFMLDLTDLINKKSKTLTNLQFRNCLILTLAIWNPRFIDSYYRRGKEVNQLEKNCKAELIEIFKSEFRDFK
ncbi:MAG: hypothetical protein ACXACX_13605 [Candidatus Hodarchaeales archaeon]|jgi:hypothetical protein